MGGCTQSKVDVASTRASRRIDRALALDDHAVVVGLAMDREIEGRALVALAGIEVAAMDDQLVAAAGRPRHYLARGLHDHAVGERGHALLLASLGHAHHPGAVLVGAGLHGELIVEPGMLVVIG